MEEEIKLMKGNEALAMAMIRYGADGYFGYPITPQSEVLETLMAQKPWETTGMVVLQAESEVASINMVYGGAASGKIVCTSSSSPGISLMQEGISYMAASELPALIINVMRGGPGLGTIQPSQADYFQATKGGGHGDYHLITLAPSSVQEMCDFVGLGWDLAFKYLTPAIILADGVVGQMMEKVVLPPQRKRLTDEEVRRRCPWAANGRKGMRKKNVITSLELDPIGILRPITLWPFPKAEVTRLSKRVKGILVPELNAGQMIEDVRLAAANGVRVEHFGRLGGIVPSPDEILDAFESLFLNK